jgi:ferric-dicitrate binding protein FerR (iron transport regulator)
LIGLARLEDLKLEGFFLLASLSLLKSRIMQNSKENIDIKVLKRYLEGIGSYEETCKVKKWFNDAESEDQLYKECLQYWDGLSLEPDVKEYDGAHILDQIYHKIKIEESVFLNKTNRFKILRRYAAIFIVAASLSGVLFYYIGNTRMAIPKLHYSELIVPLGSRAQFTLSDGTAVTLNAGSKLKYDNSFGIKDRIVQLEGEGYFKVAKDASRPFTVKTLYLNVRALGTEFNVKAYPDDKTIETTLVEGSIKVEPLSDKSHTEIMVLKPNEKLTYYKKDSTMVDETDRSNEKTENSQQALEKQKLASIPRLVTENVNVDPVISWKENRWIFDKQSLSQIAVELERKFDVQIIIESERLKSFRFTGTILAEPIDQVLQVMSLSAPINFKLKGRVVTLFENRNFEELNKSLYNQN